MSLWDCRRDLRPWKSKTEGTEAFGAESPGAQRKQGESGVPGERSCKKGPSQVGGPRHQKAEDQAAPVFGEEPCGGQD